MKKKKPTKSKLVHNTAHYIYLLCVFLLAVAGGVLYAELDPATTSAAVVTDPESAAIAPGLIAAMDKAANLDVPSWALYLSEVLLGTEFVMRIYKSKKALSWFYFLASFLGLLAKICVNIGKRFDSLVQRTNEQDKKPKS